MEKSFMASLSLFNICFTYLKVTVTEGETKMFVSCFTTRTAGTSKEVGLDQVKYRCLGTPSRSPMWLVGT